jgi:hypothetical protein
MLTKMAFWNSGESLKSWRFLIPLAAVAAAIPATAVLKSPFDREALVTRVQRLTGGRVIIGSYRQNWFPPGCIATDVQWSGRDGKAVILKKVIVETSYTALLGRKKTLSRIHASGARMVMQPAPGRLPAMGGNGINVTEIRLENTAVDFLSEPETPGRKPVEFFIHSLVLKNVDQGKKIDFQVSLHNPAPSGEIRARGQAGPMIPGDAAGTPISGTFSFENADISVPHGISGVLNARGNFGGPFRQLASSGTADVPRFQVSGSNRAVHLSAKFDATVDARNGHTNLNSVIVHFNHTTVSSTGTVVGKTVTLDTIVRDGRTEDLLGLFTRNEPPFKGPITLKSRFVIPPGPPGFLTRLTIDGDFGITHGVFTNVSTQLPIDRLSASARGESKREQRESDDMATAEIRARVTGRRGAAKLTGVVFETPGISAELEGNFGLEDPHRLDFAGAFQTTGKLADTTSGMKSFLLKAIGPIWHKREAVKNVGFTIAGNSSHPAFRLRIHDRSLSSSRKPG